MRLEARCSFIGRLPNKRILEHPSRYPRHCSRHLQSFLSCPRVWADVQLVLWSMLALQANPPNLIILFFIFLSFSWCAAFNFPVLLLPGSPRGSCSEDFLGSYQSCFALLCNLLPGQPLTLDFWVHACESWTLLPQIRLTVGLLYTPDSPVGSG